MRNVTLEGATTKQQLIRRVDSRHFKVNMLAYNRHKTLEFRQHSGTVEYTKIANWINFLAKLIQYSYENELTANIQTIEDIPFLTASEKQYFIERRAALN
jgi:hypothetical protein